MKELSNPGASGSIFYLSQDDEFIIKTVQHKEADFLQKLLPGYYMVRICEHAEKTDGGGQLTQKERGHFTHREMQSVKTQGEGVKRVSLYTRRKGQFIHQERESVYTQKERFS